MVSTRLVLVLAFAYARADELRDLLVATARGANVLKGHLSSRIPKSLLSQKDEFGFSSLAVATYLGDYLAAELLVKEGAALAPGEITAFMGDSPVKLGSIVELAVRRSSMLIMLGTGLGLRSSKTFQLGNLIKGVEMLPFHVVLAEGFKMPPYLHESQKRLSTARPPSPSNPEAWHVWPTSNYWNLHVVTV